MLEVPEDREDREEVLEDQEAPPPPQARQPNRSRHLDRTSRADSKPECRLTEGLCPGTRRREIAAATKEQENEEEGTRHHWRVDEPFHAGVALSEETEAPELQEEAAEHRHRKGPLEDVEGVVGGALDEGVEEAEHPPHPPLNSRPALPCRWRPSHGLVRELRP